MALISLDDLQDELDMLPYCPAKVLGGTSHQGVLIMSMVEEPLRHIGSPVMPLRDFDYGRIGRKHTESRQSKRQNEFHCSSACRNHAKDQKIVEQLGIKSRDDRAEEPRFHQSGNLLRRVPKEDRTIENYLRLRTLSLGWPGLGNRFLGHRGRFLSDIKSFGAVTKRTPPSCFVRLSFWVPVGLLLVV